MVIRGMVPGRGRGDGGFGVDDGGSRKRVSTKERDEAFVLDEGENETRIEVCAAQCGCAEVLGHSSTGGQEGNKRQVERTVQGQEDQGQAAEKETGSGTGRRL